MSSDSNGLGASPPEAEQEVLATEGPPQGHSSYTTTHALSPAETPSHPAGSHVPTRKQTPWDESGAIMAVAMHTAECEACGLDGGSELPTSAAG